LLRCSATKYINICMNTTIFYKTTKIIDIPNSFFRKKEKKKRKNLIIVPAFSHAALNRVCVTQCTKKLLRYSHNNQFKLQSLNDDYVKKIGGSSTTYMMIPFQNAPLPLIQSQATTICSVIFGPAPTQSQFTPAALPVFYRNRHS